MSKRISTNLHIIGFWFAIICLVGAVFISYIESANSAQDTILAAAARTATTTTSDIVKSTEKGVHFILNVTVVPGVDTITPKIQGKDSLGNYYDLLVGSAISTTGITVLKISPGIGVLANGSAADVMPDVYRIIITASGTGSFTYSLAANKSN